MGGDGPRFLDGFVAPVVADPEGFAAEFAEWLVDGRAEPAVQRWRRCISPRRATVGFWQCPGEFNERWRAFLAGS